MARDCTAAVAPNTQRAPVGNQSGIVCCECGRPGHYRKDYPKLRNQNRWNKTGNKTRNHEATTKAYAIGGGGANPDYNVITVLIPILDQFLRLSKEEKRVLPRIHILDDQEEVSVQDPKEVLQEIFSVFFDIHSHEFIEFSKDFFFENSSLDGMKDFTPFIEKSIKEDLLLRFHR
ncbi:hypothetical protein Tco_1325645 [Tanacetum coccineum]